MAFSVAGKTAIVTGAGSGINYCFARLLLQKQCNVILADIALRPEAKELVSQYSSRSVFDRPRAIFQRTDVTDWPQLEHTFKAAQEEFHGADIVCPGAGVYEPPFSNFWHPPGKYPSKDDPALSHYALLDINLTHPIRMTQLAIAHFISRSKPGAIIHISSIAAQKAFFPTPIYVATKHAISGFVRSLAPLETPPAGSSLPSVRVSAVAPGVVRTPLWTESEEKLKMISEGADEWVSPEEVARAMLDLIEKKENVGGTVLEVVKGMVRRVEALSDPGPQGSGHSVSNSVSEEKEIWDRLREFSGSSS